MNDYGNERFDYHVEYDDEASTPIAKAADDRSVLRRERANKIKAQNQQGVRGKSGIERRNRKHTGAHR